MWVQKARRVTDFSAVVGLYAKLWTEKIYIQYFFIGKSEKWSVHVPGTVVVCVCVFADCVDSGLVWMKENTSLVLEEWGPTPATQGSCYPLLCCCSRGDFNECSCSNPLLAPIRLSAGLPPPPCPCLSPWQVVLLQDSRLGWRRWGGLADGTE